MTAGHGISGSFTSVTPGYAVSIVDNRVVLTATAPSAPLASLSEPRGRRDSQGLPRAP